MKILDKIILPEAGTVETVTIFYRTFTHKKQFLPGEIFPEDVAEKDCKKHCEMFCKSDLSSFTMNPRSFFLRFRKRSGAKDIKFYFSSPEQVQGLIELAQYRFEKGLQVKEFYADISLREKLKA